MKKRSVLMIVVLALLICCLAACGKKDDNKNAATATPTATTAPTSEPEETPTPTPVPTDTPTPTPAPTDTPTPTPSPTPRPQPSEPVYLREIFAEHGMKLGTCLTTMMTGNAATSKLITEQFSSITMENSMKPDYLFNKDKSIETGKLVVEFNKDMLSMLEWAKTNNMAVRGHTLVWYSQTPQWIFHEDFDDKKPFVSREVMLERMESYIKQVFDLLKETGYADIIYAYDVVNEAWMENGTMRSQWNNWYSTIGEDYIWYAFYFANKYAPSNIDLYYNDYNEQFKTETLVKFVETLKDDKGNYLIDGIGFQAHLYTMDDMKKYFETMDRIAELGLKIQLTELDVCLGKYNAPKQPTEENLLVQGQYYYNLINGIFERVDSGAVKMDALTLWGFSDAMSWRKEYSPLIYDKLGKQKYAYYGVAQMKEYAGFDEE